MRVLNAMLSGGRGGIEMVFAHYDRALRSQNSEVMNCIAPGALVQESMDADAPVITLANRSQLDPRALWRAHCLLRDFKPDVVLVHGRRAFMIFALAQLLFGKRAPIVQVLHRARFKNLRWAAHTITVSQQLSEQVLAQGIHAENVSYIPNFLPALPAASAARPFQTPPVIGVLGRMVPVKGFDLFIEALGLLKQRGMSVRAHIGGIGALEESLHAQAKALGVDEQITWLGWMNGSNAFYEAIDVFCVPSRAESFGMVVIEAFANGKPVVSTRTSGPSELIVSGETGLLCEITAEAIADALAAMLQNPQRAAQWAAKARMEAARYTMETVAPQIVACLQKVVQASAH